MPNPTLTSLLTRKRILQETLLESLGERRAELARRDYHARRKPRPCGLTIHSVIGCTGRCAYCYLPDMNVSFREARPYALSAQEIILAILLNPYFLPGRWGTYLAIGSIGEPFHPVGMERTLEYMSAFAKYLRNPVQFSTKMLSERGARRLASFKNYPLSPLITIIKLVDWRSMEPGVLPPEDRFLTIKALRSTGFYPFLFLRPLLPGINEDEFADILKESKRAGAVGVVIGGLRITPLIINRLKSLGFNVNEILKRVNKSKLREKTQVPVDTADIKARVASIARECGLVALYSACCATTYAAYLTDGERVPCAGLCFIDKRFCARCPMRCEEVEISVDLEEVSRYLRNAGIPVRSVNLDGFNIVIEADNPRKAWNKLRRSSIKTLIETAYRRRLIVG